MSTQSISKKIEVIANIGIIVVAAAVVALLIRNYWLKPAQDRGEIQAGQRLPLNQVNWQLQGKSVVLAASTTCHFCTESAPFYRNLAEHSRERHVRFIAVFPQPVAESKTYLSNEGVQVDDIRQASLPELQIKGTPTLLLVDRSGTVKSVWRGKLPPEKEQEVLATLD